MRLTGKVALVVGAGTSKKEFSDQDAIGNGAACAIRFAQEGAIVLCADRNLKSAEETATLIKENHDQAAFAIEMDVLNSVQIDSTVQSLVRRFGRIDVLHNNVGTEIHGELVDIRDDDWDAVMAINLRGAMATSRAVVPYMRNQKQGSIINVSSTASLKWSQMQFLSYSTSKAALNHMTRVIARQYASDQVRCNAIIPGMIKTPHADALYSSADEAELGHIQRNGRCPMGRQGSPWDIANAAVFLASDESSYITGAQLVIDGGSSL